MLSQRLGIDFDNGSQGMPPLKKAKTTQGGERPSGQRSWSNVKRLQLDREVMIQVDNSAAEAQQYTRAATSRHHRRGLPALDPRRHRRPPLQGEGEGAILGVRGPAG